MNPAQGMAVILLGGAGTRPGRRALYAILPVSRGRRVDGRTALARAGSYAALAVALALAIVDRNGRRDRAARARSRPSPCSSGHGSAGCRSATSSRSQIANAVVMVAIAMRGTAAADILVGGLAFAAALLPVARPDTSRAFRDFGTAAAGLVVITVMLVHGVALTVERGPAGAALVAAVAIGCAGSDVGAFFVGAPVRADACWRRGSRRTRRAPVWSATSSARRSPCWWRRPVLVPADRLAWNRRS